MTKTIIKTTVLLAILAFPCIAMAQPGGDFGDPDASVPIDGGLSILLAAGVGYGAKKIKDKRTKKAA